jgi:Ca2+-binding RTX toxin-like protein
MPGSDSGAASVLTFFNPGLNLQPPPHVQWTDVIPCTLTARGLTASSAAIQMEDTMEHLYFKDPRPLSIATISPDSWRDQSGTDGPDSLVGDWSRAPSFASKDDIGGLRIHAGKGHDTVRAGFGNDVVWGGIGDDKLFGEDGVDELYGEDDNDTLDGGANNDHLYGGTGNDHLYGQAGDDYLHGEDDNDYLWGGGNNDHLYGGDGVDFLLGESGHDHLYGGAGNDTVLDGGWGDDEIYGGVGDDLIIGGGARDDLWGGDGLSSFPPDGADTFRWRGLSDLSVGVNPLDTTTMDKIWDFNPGEGDRINLTDIAWQCGQFNLKRVASVNDFTANDPLAAQVSFELNVATNEFTIWLNTDLDAQADAGIQVVLIGMPPIETSWFIGVI